MPRQTDGQTVWWVDGEVDTEMYSETDAGWSFLLPWAMDRLVSMDTGLKQHKTILLLRHVWVFECVWTCACVLKYICTMLSLTSKVFHVVLAGFHWVHSSLENDVKSSQTHSNTVKLLEQTRIQQDSSGEEPKVWWLNTASYLLGQHCQDCNDGMLVTHFCSAWMPTGLYFPSLVLMVETDRFQRRQFVYSDRSFIQSNICISFISWIGDCLFLQY